MLWFDVVWIVVALMISTFKLNDWNNQQLQSFKNCWTNNLNLLWEKKQLWLVVVWLKPSKTKVINKLFHNKCWTKCNSQKTKTKDKNQDYNRGNAKIMDDRKIGCRETLMTMFKHLALRHSTISTKSIKKTLHKFYKHYWNNSKRVMSPLMHEYLAMQKLQCKSCTHHNKTPNNHLYTSHRKNIYNKKFHYKNARKIKGKKMFTFHNYGSISKFQWWNDNGSCHLPSSVEGLLKR
jgi:hypothetical protein